MKRISTIVMALALVLSLSQCKKNEQNNAENQGEAVTITLDVSGASTSTTTDGSRVIVNPATGTVNFENNDQIIVASGGKYVGALTYNGSLFTGAISNASEGYPLQFYFLGNVTPTETLTSGVTESCSVVISDQTQHLPVISAAPSNENYTASTTDYTAHLLNKCALVKFNVTTPSESPICITGMKNKVTVDFINNTMTPSQDGEGVIMLPAGSGENVEKWAILLPQEALGAGEVGSSYSGSYYGTRKAVPAITENGYLTSGVEVVVNTPIPIGSINGLFTINGNGDKVFFSQGNLQYIGSASTPYWKFAENQWDYLGHNGQGSTNQNVDRDLFGWGTSGWNNGNIFYHPWDTQDNGVYSTGYGYGPTDGTNYTYDLSGTYANSDWGVYNSIFNGGNQSNQWRTLTTDEWVYIIDTRNTISGVRYAKAQVNDVEGMILLPDDWDVTYFTLNNTNLFDYEISFSNNIISAIQWDILEQHGAVFLPAARYRVGTSVEGPVDDGRYWSASCLSGMYSSCVSFNRFGMDAQSYEKRYCGLSVRLVYDVE